MAHIREKTRQLNQNIIEDYYETGLSHAALAAKYGRSDSMVKKLLARDRLENGPRERKATPADPRKLEDRQPISFLHAHIGHLVGRYLVQHNVSPTAFGMLGRLALSRVQVREITMGVFDPTITQVEALAEVLGVTYETLVCPPQREKQLVSAH